MKHYKLLLSIILFGATLLNGCGGGSPPGISGAVYLGGEPLAALPTAGASSLNRITPQSMILSSNKQIPPSSLIIRCKSSLSEVAQRTAIQDLGFKIISKLKHIPDTFVIHPNQTSIDTAYQLAKTAGFVAAVEYNYELIKMATTPNDEYYHRQWDMRVTKFDTAWDEYKGQIPVTVAVLDTGINVDSPEFQNRLAPSGDWYDFVDDDADPREPTQYFSGDSQFSHGTNVAGIISAAPNNAIGYAGAAWDKIMILPIRVLDSQGSGSIATITDGIYWAVLHKANVINLSLGGPANIPNSNLLDNAIGYANTKNVTVVCAAGNYNYGPAIQYPALLAGTYSNVIAVGATGFNNLRTNYSCIGPELTVLAPGGDTTDCIWNITFDKQSIPQKEEYDIGFAGTSQATPHVSALAALLYSYGITTPAKIKEIITQTATDLDPPGRDDQNGYGLINAFAALVRATESNITAVTIGLRYPGTMIDVITPVQPSSDGFYQILNPPSGKFELYATYPLTTAYKNEYKYEKSIIITINGSMKQDLVLQLIPSI